MPEHFVPCEPANYDGEAESCKGQKEFNFGMATSKWECSAFNFQFEGQIAENNLEESTGQGPDSGARMLLL